MSACFVLRIRALFLHRTRRHLRRFAAQEGLGESGNNAIHARCDRFRHDACRYERLYLFHVVERKAENSVRRRQRSVLSQSATFVLCVVTAKPETCTIP